MTTHEPGHHAGAAETGAYAEAYRRSLEDPAGFWGDAASAVDWIMTPRRVLDDDTPPFYRWFTGGVLNTCYNAVDRHVIGGRADQAALIYDSPVTGSIRTYTYAELLELVARFAGVLRALGVEQGDRVVVYMPMIPEAVVAMLACARIGAVHSVVFGGFAPAELAVRIDDARPKVVVTASCGIEPTRVVPVQADARRGDRPRDPHAGPHRRPAASAGHSRAGGARRGVGERRCGRTPSSPPPRCRCRPRTRCTSSTRRGPPDDPRESCATTAGMPWP